MSRSLATSLLWRGLLALTVGIIAIAWPGVTIVAVVIIFAIWAFADAFGQAVRAFSSDGAGPTIGHLLLAALDVIAGVVAIAWPGITALVLTICIGIWAVVVGAGEFALAFLAGESAGQRALFGLGGLLTISLGIVLFARPQLGAATLAELFGLFCLASGIVSLALAANLRDNDTSLSDVLA